MSTWFGDFNTICFSACVPLPSCNLLRSNNQNVSLSGLVSGAEADQCLSGPTSNVRDYSTAVIVVLGIVFIVYRRLRRPFGMSSAVGRAEMNMLLFTYSCILLLQFFTIGGIARNNGTFMVWASALHLGATACFFWTLIINAVILFQFVEDNTKTIQLIIGTNIAWMVGITYTSLDLGFSLNRNHQGHHAGLFFSTLIFPVIAVLVYAVLVIVLVFKKLDDHQALKYVAMALFTFAASQALLFVASPKIAALAHGHVDASVFSTLLDMLSMVLLFKFWNGITDDTWGDGAL